MAGYCATCLDEPEPLFMGPPQGCSAPVTRRKASEPWMQNGTSHSPTQQLRFVIYRWNVGWFSFWSSRRNPEFEPLRLRGFLADNYPPGVNWKLALILEVQKYRTAEDIDGMLGFPQTLPPGCAKTGASKT